MQKIRRYAHVKRKKETTENLPEEAQILDLAKNLS